jgi:hypothetical protein
MWVWFSLPVCLKRFLFQEEFREIILWRCISFHTKYPLFLLHFSEIWNFSKDYRKNTQVSNFIKVLSGGAKLFRADRRTHMRKLYSSIYIQQDATLHSLFISGNCCTCFGWYLHASSGAQTTVSAASGICHTVTATCRWLQVAVTVRQIPDAADTVVCAPDDEWRYHPKHIEQFPDIINCVTLHLIGYILEYS